MWGNMTATVTIGEGSAFVFVADHCNDRVHRPPCGQEREPVRGPGSTPASASGTGNVRGTLRRHQRRGPPHDQQATYRPTIFQEDLRHRKLPELPRRRRGGFIRTLKENVFVGALRTRSRTSASPCSSSSGRTSSTGCWRGTTRAPRRCDATSSSWTRRRCEYRQTTVQEP